LGAQRGREKKQEEEGKKSEEQLVNKTADNYENFVPTFIYDPSPLTASTLVRLQLFDVLTYGTIVTKVLTERFSPRAHRLFLSVFMRV